MEKKEAEREATKTALFEQFKPAVERQFGPSTEKYRGEQGDLVINEAGVAVRPCRPNCRASRSPMSCPRKPATVPGTGAR